MGEYGYVRKDYLMHYGVKGMKWHKHLKRKFDSTIGLTQKNAYDNNNKRSKDIVNQYYEVLSSKDPYKVRGPVALDKNRNPYMQMVDEMNADDKSVRSYRKYKNTPLGKIERSSKLGKKVVDAYANADKAVTKAIRKRNVEKRKKQIAKNKKNSEKEKLNALLEKGRANAAKEKISTSEQVFSRKKSHDRNVQIYKSKTKIPGITKNGYIVQPKTISKKKRK